MLAARVRVGGARCRTRVVSVLQGPPPSSHPAGAPRVLVVGCGGIGGTLAASLGAAGVPVVGLSTNAAIAAAVRAAGYRLSDRGGPVLATPGRIIEDVGGERFDVVLLATQPPQVEDAARRALPALAPDGRMVVLQNGLCEERVAAIVGPERVVGAVVMWGASMPEPGLYRRTSAGGFVLGRLDGAQDPKLEGIAALLGAVGPARITTDLRGARWTKLAVNSAISTLGTIGGDRLGALLRHAFARRLGLEIMTEAALVARAEGVRLQRLAGFDLDRVALTDGDRRGSLGLVLKHALLVLVGLRYRNLRSSMLAAIERGRPPAVDFLNGELVVRGERHGIPTPVNRAAAEMVRDIAAGRARSSLDSLRGLAASSLLRG